MKINVTPSDGKLNYPYMAIYKGIDHDNKVPKKIELEDILLISMVKDPDLKDEERPYVQNLFGSRIAYFTNHEEEYCPLPNGYNINLTQGNV
jgi:hypothetical protein